MTKNLFKAALAAAVATSFATPALADTEPFTATAIIVKPLELTKNDNLDFGTITLGSGLVSSTVVISQAGARTCGANLTCAVGHTVGSFTVDGVRDQLVDIDFTAPATLDDGNGNTVAFSADAPSSVTLDNSGTVDFGFGGTITLTGATVDGTYDATFDVTASYN